jgi:hypothetical protein
VPAGTHAPSQGKSFVQFAPTVTPENYEGWWKGAAPSQYKRPSAPDTSTGTASRGARNPTSAIESDRSVATAPLSLSAGTSANPVFVRSGSEEYTQYSATAAETTAQVISDDQELQRTRLQAYINQSEPRSEARSEAEREMSKLNNQLGRQFGNFVAGLKSGTGISSVQVRSNTQVPISAVTGIATTPASSSDAATSSGPIHSTSQSILKQRSDTAQQPVIAGRSQRTTSSSHPDSSKSVSFEDATSSGATAMSDRIVAPGPPPKMSEEEADKGHKEWVERLKNRPIQKR